MNAISLQYIKQSWLFYGCYPRKQNLFAASNARKPSGLVLWFPQLEFGPAAKNKLHQGTIRMLYIRIILNDLNCKDGIVKVYATFFMRTPFKLISNWFSRFCRSLMLRPESSSPINCLCTLKWKYWLCYQAFHV